MLLRLPYNIRSRERVARTNSERGKNSRRKTKDTSTDPQQYHGSTIKPLTTVPATCCVLCKAHDCSWVRRPEKYEKIQSYVQYTVRPRGTQHGERQNSHAGVPPGRRTRRLSPPASLVVPVLFVGGPTRPDGPGGRATPH